MAGDLMKKFSTSFKGYNKHEVNDFVAEVADKYQAMLNNLRQRDHKIKELNEQMQHYKNMESTLNKAVSIAEETSSQIKKIARDESNSIIKEAKQNASRIINEALLKSSKIEQESINLKHRVNIMKTRLKQTLEEELAIIDDIDDIDY